MKIFWNWGVKSATVAFASCLASLSVAQTSKPVSYAVDVDTRAFAQQIDHRVQFHRNMPENPAPPLKWEPNLGDRGQFHVGDANLPPVPYNGPLYPGVDYTGWYPPDPTIAAGPNYLVETVNSEIAFYQKSNGAVVFDQTFSTFFSGLGAGSFIFDPKVIYDKPSGRFIVCALEADFNNNISKILIGVSTSSNPNGTWHTYRVEARRTISSNLYWMDYPSLGASSTGIVISGNEFPFANGNYGGCQYITLSKANAIAGSALTPYTLLDPNAGTSRMAQNWEASQSNIFAVALESTASVRVTSIANPGVASTSFTTTIVSVPSFTPAQQDATSTSGQVLDTISDRVFQVFQRNGHLVVAHDVQGTSGRARSVARWYQIALNSWPASGAPSVLQSGNVDTGTNDDDFMPALDEDAFGNISMIFSRSNSGVVADIMKTSRKPSDASGSMATPTVLMHSLGSYYALASRWGDYFEVALDPEDSATFWGVGMLSDASDNWQTEFFNWQVQPKPPVVIFPHAVTTTLGTNTGGTLENLDSVDTNYYTVHSVADTHASEGARIELDFTLPAVQNIASLRFNIASITPVKSTVYLYVWNFATSSYQYLTAYAGGKSSGELAFPISTFAPYLGSGNNLRIVARVFQSQKGGTLTPFNWSVDEGVVQYTPN